MMRFILQILLAIISIRIVFGIIQYAARLASGDQGPRLPGNGRGAQAPKKPLVDRSSAIDVPFTEEHPTP